MIVFPPADPLPQDNQLMPYFLLGDDAFALRTWMMKPFSQWNMSDEQRIFNYRLSQAMCNVENAFRILANQFQCLLSPLLQQPKTVNSIVLACACLHNLMQMCYPGLQKALLDQEDDQHQLIPGCMEKWGQHCRMWTIWLVATELSRCPRSRESISSYTSTLLQDLFHGSKE